MEIILYLCYIHYIFIHKGIKQNLKYRKQRVQINQINDMKIIYGKLICYADHIVLFVEANSWDMFF